MRKRRGGKERRGERKKEEGKTERKEGRNGEKLFNDPITKIQSEATLIHPGFFFFF